MDSCAYNNETCQSSSKFSEYLDSILWYYFLLYKIDQDSHLYLYIITPNFTEAEVSPSTLSSFTLL